MLPLIPRQDAAEAPNQGLDDTRALQHLVGMLLQTVADNNAAMSSHDHAVQAMTQKTEHDMSVVMSAVTVIMASTSSLQNDLVRGALFPSESMLTVICAQTRFHAQSTDLAQQQNSLEQVSNPLALNSASLTTGRA